MAAPLAWLAVDVIERRRLMAPRAPLLTSAPYPALRTCIAYLAVGALGAVALWWYSRLLRMVVLQTNVDLLHFSLHPLDANRLALAFGLVLLHAATVWTAAALARLPTVLWRAPRGQLAWLATIAWAGGALLAVAAISTSPAATPAMPLLLALAASMGCAIALSRLRLRARHVSQTLRLGALFMALLAPSLALYPTLLAFATDAKEQLIANEYGPEALSLRDDLQHRVDRARDQIDALPALAEYVTAASDTETPTTDRGFLVWSQTDLGTYRLTSAVELYRGDGRLVSRFALKLPAYGAGPYSPGTCGWAISDDISPIGASEPHVLRASRGICVRGRVVGAVVVRAMVDYRTLPFIAPQDPYLESLRPDRRALGEDVTGRDVEFAVYGWSRAPIDARGPSVWTLPDRVFDRTVASRDRFWDTLDRDGASFRVYFLSDRGGIYALGYPVITPFGHLINLAELVMLAFALYRSAGRRRDHLWHADRRNPLQRPRAASRGALELLPQAVPVLLGGRRAAGRDSRHRDPDVLRGRARSRRDRRRRQDGDRGAAARRRLRNPPATRRDARCARRRHHGSGESRHRRGREPVRSFELCWRRASATCSRHSCCPHVRRPTSIVACTSTAPLCTSAEQAVGPVGYLVAAAPVRTGGREGIVTVPVTLRQREIEQQIDELDRRVLFGAVLFSLLGGALGYWMAERVADPVSRLTRATRRIARGDLDARVAAAATDELGRLVEDFNRMAADLKQQRAELERTQRLEAWADMARQVAHDIKNPLTPIQLSAEHALRINRDTGRPLSPVLDECVTAILGQVRLLRQIASEFSSFASSPTSRPELTDVAALVDEVVAPYRTGLGERIAITVDASAGLPAARIDRNLFARALTNVIENALHAMPGSGRLTISVRQGSNPESPVPAASHQPPATSHQPAATIVVQVTDTGVGMDQDALGRIFEPYFSTKATGTGLGLTIAKRNVELNGGTIAVTSQRGAGTTVTIELPVT